MALGGLWFFHLDFNQIRSETLDKVALKYRESNVWRSLDSLDSRYRDFCCCSKAIFSSEKRVIAIMYYFALSVLPLIDTFIYVNKIIIKSFIKHFSVLLIPLLVYIHFSVHVIKNLSRLFIFLSRLRRMCEC